MTPQISLITRGVRDLPAARAFYARLGMQDHGKSQSGIAFYQRDGQSLALLPVTADGILALPDSK